MSELTYEQFMKGMINAPFNHDLCEHCGGTGLRALMCCSGHECGCYGLPVDFDDCSCGRFEPPPNEKIAAWAHENH